MSQHNAPLLSYQEPSETPPNSPPLNQKNASVNYATYQPPTEPVELQTWIPVPLRLWFWIPFSGALVLLAVGLEVALYYSNRDSGFPVPRGFSVDSGHILHYLLTVPPSFLATLIVGLWAWTDLEMKRLQPYVDLVHGDSPPERSLLLDYTRENKFTVWSRAWSNGHTLIFITSVVVLMAIALPPLAGALLAPGVTPWDPQPFFIVNNSNAIGLNQSPEFTDLAGFVTAAGYASSAILYNLTDPPYIHDAWTVGRFDMPSYLGQNGSFSVNTAAILSDPGCIAAPPINLTQSTNNTEWTATATSIDGECSVTWTIDKNTTTSFGTDILQCGPTDDSDATLRSVVFWFFTYLPQVASSAVICNPTISLYDVHVELDLATGNIKNITTLGNFTTGNSPYSSVSGNVTGPPLNGSAFNGIGFNLTQPTDVDSMRELAIQLQLPASMYEYAEHSLNNSALIYNSDAMVPISKRVYTTYLKLLAQTAYFLPVSEPMTMNVTLILSRLFLSSVAVHLVAIILILIAALGTIVQLSHRSERQLLRLAHQPGTIASAVSIGAQTHIGELLAGRQRHEDIETAMRGRMFGINPRTMQIVTDDEPGYKEATVLGLERRKSVFLPFVKRHSSNGVK